MNGLEILQHAYSSIEKAFPQKTAFEIVEDVESIAQRIAAAAKVIESAVVTITAAPASTSQG